MENALLFEEVIILTGYLSVVLFWHEKFGICC